MLESTNSTVLDLKEEIKDAHAENEELRQHLQESEAELFHLRHETETNQDLKCDLHSFTRYGLCNLLYAQRSEQRDDKEVGQAGEIVVSGEGNSQVTGGEADSKAS